MKKEKLKILIPGIILGLVVGWFLANIGKPVFEPQTGLTITVPLGANENQIITPANGDIITSPVAVAGNLYVFENQFTISVFDGSGKELGRQSGYAHSSDIGKPGPFIELVGFAEPKTPEGKIEIWTSSAKDGSKQVLFSIPVRF